MVFAPEVLRAMNSLEVLEIINGEYRADSPFCDGVDDGGDTVC